VSESLRDQLLRAGLVKKTAIKKAEKNAYQQAKNVRQHQKKIARTNPSVSAVVTAIKDGQAQKSAKDKQLNQEKEAALLRKANNAEVRNLIQSTRLNDETAEISYCFTVEDKIKRIYITKTQQTQLTHGQLAVILFNRRYQLVPLATAERVRVLNPRLFVHLGGKEVTDNTSIDVDYPPIPDDLMW
jgi:uncharacterized protein